MIENIKEKTYNALRWSERYTKTDMIYLAKGGFWLTLGQIISSLLAFGLSIIYANFLSKETYGVYKYILSISAILGSFTLTGMSVAITNSVAKGFDGILKSGFLTNLKWSLFLFLAAIFASIYYFINENNVLATSLLVMGFLLPLIQSAALYSDFLIGKKKFNTLSKYGIITSVVNAFVVGSAAFLSDNPLVIIVLFFLSNTIITLFFYRKTINNFVSNNKIEAGSIEFGKHLSFMSILSKAISNLDMILIFHYFGAAKLAIYAFAIALPNQLKFIRKGLRTLALPKISEKSIIEIKKIVPGKAVRMFFFIIPIVLAYILSAPYIFKYIFPQYIDSVVYSQIFSLSILFYPTLLINQALIASMKQKYLYITNLSTPIINIILFLLLIPQYEIFGAVYAILLSKIINTFILIYLFKKI